MTDNSGATQAIVEILWETLSVRWYDHTDLAFDSGICKSKSVLLLVSCGAFANEFLTRYRFKELRIGVDEMLVRSFLGAWTCDSQTYMSLSCNIFVR